MKIEGTVLFLIAAAFLLAGCTTTQSTKARPLKAVYGADADLRPYHVATVQRFEVLEPSLEHPDPGVMLSDRIAQRLANDFGQLFQQVRTGAPLLQDNELLISGRVTKFKPGSRLGRAFGPGITPASFEAELILKDAQSGQPILIAPIDKLWAWGGGLGAAKGIEDMIEESAAAAANTIARAKGWQPLEPARR